jgi:hypothetical protein
MICRISVAVLAIVLASVMPAFSEYALDVGANTCTKWVEARKVRGGLADVVHAAWLNGYLSAAAALLQGEARSAVFQGKNDQRLIEKADILNPRYIQANAIDAWMDKYCHAHPLEKIADAVPILVSELKQKSGYLQEAVCENSDLKEEARAICRKAFEETRRSAVSSLDDNGAGPVVVGGGAHRPQPAGRERPPGSPQVLPITNLMGDGRTSRR